ncbi:MAG: hypothetical protein JWQ87_2281 [Candidatus Sulfotelmatobacter sp.]|nr:hypothetical protein [Candidatus Sulfotelmatobacter sp.]
MPRNRAGWLDVDLVGLGKVLARRGKEFLVYELVQNAWDEKCTQVDISLPRPQGGLTRLTVTDDAPGGFKKLTHAFTLFAESYKKTHATQRGAFNAGDKFVLALCEQASVISTKGGVLFDVKGRHRTRKRTKQGSQFSGLLKISVTDWERICKAVHQLIPPVKTIFNGQVIPTREPLHQFECVLPTVIADESGILRKKMRRTEVRVYEPRQDESATLYEMGLPVVGTGDTWHVDIQQKVPLNMERDNVVPSFLQAVRVAVLNQMAGLLQESEASTTWVRQAAGDERIEQDCFTKIINLRFGNKRVTYDPSDVEANLIATSKGYVVIGSAALSAEEWENVRRFKTSLPAGQVTPSPRPFSPDGRPLRLLADIEKDAFITQFQSFAEMLGRELTGRTVTVVLADDPGWRFEGCYGASQLTINVYSKGKDWFRGSSPDLLEKWIPFLVHEFAHHKVHGHLTEKYHLECCRLAGVLARRMHEDPSLFAECLHPPVS